MSAEPNLSFFGTYDLRAVVSETFNGETYYWLGRAYGQWLLERTSVEESGLWVAVGQDARLHSKEFSEALIQGLREEEIHVVDLGMCPSPVVYFSEYHSCDKKDIPDFTGTLVVTASHNPAAYNGLKFTYRRHALSPEDIQRLKRIYVSLRQEKTEPKSEKKGFLTSYQIIPHYIDWLAGRFSKVETPIHVVVDSGNATGGLVAPELFRQLGCRVTELYSEPDGRFPNHHPDPCKHKNLTTLIKVVQESQADFGIAFDGDSDRLGVVDNQGRVIPGDILLLLYAQGLLEQWPQHLDPPLIIGEVKCSQLLFDEIARLGGEPMMSPTGHVCIKNLMKERNAVLGGELSGHFFFRDRYFGFDDAFYAALRFLELYQSQKRKQPTFQVADFLDGLPKTHLSEEKRVPCPKQLHQEMVELLGQRMDKALAAAGVVVTDKITIDGLRFSFKGGFLLIRSSNTEPVLTIRHEAPDSATSSQLEAILNQELDLPKASA